MDKPSSSKFQETLVPEAEGVIVTIREIFEIWAASVGDSSRRVETVTNRIFEVFGITSEVRGHELSEKIRKICSKLAEKWQKCNRHRHRFLEKNSSWLDGEVTSPISKVDTRGGDQTPTTSGQGERGRPKKSFISSSERTKRRKILELKKDYEGPQIVKTAEKTLKDSGMKDAAWLLKEATQRSPLRATKIRNKWRMRDGKPYNEDDALSLIVESNLSRSQYMTIRLQAKSRHFNMYPNYHKVLCAKEKCYPPLDSLTITEAVMEIKLQLLLDHTASRIILPDANTFETLSSKDKENIVMLTKWGFDGSTSHSEYKQIMSEEFQDSDMIVTSLVPIQLICVTNKKTLWQNPRPSSTRYCRPIRIQFKKESHELSRLEREYFQEQINNLHATQYKDILIKHKMVMTMVDGKVCCAVTETSSAQKCYVCGASPKEMNSIEAVLKREVETDRFEFGLSTLHAWIRFLEYLLHISYRLDIRKWQARGHDKEKVQLRKQEIQRRFKSEMGLIVDKVKPGGSGTSNDGNTARRFFANYRLSADILGIEENIIRRCAVILTTLASEYKINTQAFKQYALDTAMLLVEKYPWFYMPASIHKILIHGPSIIEHALVPIGQLSKEAQESRNKDVRRYRENFTRKISRLHTNKDLICRLLVTSDPYITSLRTLPVKRKHVLNDEMALLLEQEQSVQSSETDSSVQEDSDDDYDDEDEW